MILNEIFESKKKIVQPSPYEIAYNELMDLKNYGKRCGENLSHKLQLFVPRKLKRLHTKKERYESLLGNKYAFNDEGNLLPYYQKWVNSVTEGAPILVNVPTSPGDNKPVNAFWTSSAIKMKNGTWTSQWQKFAKYNVSSGNTSDVGYLYKIKPGIIVLDFDSQGEAERIYKIFNILERGNNAFYNQEEWDKANEFDYYVGTEKESRILQKDFPWIEISKHFDAVHHNWGGRPDHYNKFLEGWDVESTAFFNRNYLELLGQVKLWQKDDWDVEDIDR